MNYRIKLFVLIIFGNVLAIIILFNLRFSLNNKIADSKESHFLRETKVSLVNDKQYGYTDITDLFYKFPKLKITKLSNSLNILTVDLELIGSESDIDEFTKYLWKKDNFSGVTRLSVNQKNLEEKGYLMSLEFFFNK